MARSRFREEFPLPVLPLCVNPPLCAVFFPKHPTPKPASFLFPTRPRCSHTFFVTPSPIRPIVFTWTVKKPPPPGNYSTPPLSMWPQTVGPVNSKTQPLKSFFPRPRSTLYSPRPPQGDTDTRTGPISLLRTQEVVPFCPDSDKVSVIFTVIGSLSTLS